MQLNIVKNSFKEDLHSPEKHYGLLHGTKVMLNILQPWVNNQRRVVSADSYFASVQACDDLKKRVLRFIGVVKTATRGFCMEKLSNIELARRGLWKGKFSLNNEKKLEKFALVWVDRDQRYLISNTSSLKSGIPYARDILR